jgi:hypothetical protein
MAKGTSTICDSYHEAQTDMNNFRRRRVQPRVSEGGREEGEKMIKQWA